MRNRLPVYIDNLELPVDDSNTDKRRGSYGYVSILNILSLVITAISIFFVFSLWR